MDGFHTHKQDLLKRQRCRQRLPFLLVGATVAFSLCINSGCATMQGAKKDLHSVTCGEGDAKCDCSCGECTAKLHTVDEATPHGEHVSTTHAAEQQNRVVPPSGQTGSGTLALQPKFMTIEGMRGVWTPEQSSDENSEFVESQEAEFDRGANTPRSSQQSSNEHFSGASSMQGNSSVSFNQLNRHQGAYCAPDTTRSDEELKETRTLIHVLSQQISQMMQTQDSIKASQDSLQQSHEREILEFKLQQANAERDRLERDRELDRELQRLREHNLETIDSISQVVENLPQIPAAPVAASSGNFRSVPRSSAQSGQGQSKMTEILPAVE